MYWYTGFRYWYTVRANTLSKPTTHLSYKRFRSLFSIHYISDQCRDVYPNLSQQIRHISLSPPLSLMCVYSERARRFYRDDLHQKGGSGQRDVTDVGLADIGATIREARNHTTTWAGTLNSTYPS